MMSSFSISIQQIRSFFANLNAIALLVGYALFTSLIFGTKADLDESSIRVYSIIYRAFALFVALATIFINSNVPLLISKKILPFFLLWLLFSIRIIYDLFIRTPEISSQDTMYIFQFVFGGVLIPTLAIYLSYRDLNLKLIFYAIFYILVFIIVKAVIVNFGIHLPRWGRAQMNIAQSTLTFGSFGGLLCLQSFTMLNTTSLRHRQRILFILTFIIGIYALGIAGSRGPLFGVVLTILISLFSENIVLSIKRSLYIIIGLVVLGPLVLYFVELYFPAIYNRTYETIVYFSLGGREPIFKAAFDQIVNNPIFGDWFLLDRTQKTSFAHNAFLDATMSLGIFGGILIIYVYIILYKNAIKIINTKSVYSFWGYTTLFYMIYSLTTGGNIYQKGDFNFSFIVLLIICSDNTKIFNQIFCKKTST